MHERLKYYSNMFHISAEPELLLEIWWYMDKVCNEKDVNTFKNSSFQLNICIEINELQVFKLIFSTSHLKNNKYILQH